MPDCRHHVARVYLSQSRSITYVQRLLGHAQASTLLVGHGRRGRRRDHEFERWLSEEDLTPYIVSRLVACGMRDNGDVPIPSSSEFAGIQHLRVTTQGRRRCRPCALQVPLRRDRRGLVVCFMAIRDGVETALFLRADAIDHGLAPTLVPRCADGPCRSCARLPCPHVTGFTVSTFACVAFSTYALRVQVSVRARRSFSSTWRTTP